MLVLAIIIGLLFVLVGSATVCFSCNGEESGLIGSFLIILGTAIVFIFVFRYDRPTAMDVYRGKTTLEITYKDGVAIDSVVVYK